MNADEAGAFESYDKEKKKLSSEATICIIVGVIAMLLIISAVTFAILLLKGAINIDSKRSNDIETGKKAKKA